MPILSIIVPWSDRPEIKTTLSQNHAIFRKYDVEVIVVCCGGDFSRLREQFANQSLPEVRWLELPTDQFNKSLALNIGAALAKAEQLFFLDTDVLLKYDFLDEALQRLDDSSFVTVDRVFESHPQVSRDDSELKALGYSIEFVTSDDRTVRVETNRIRFDDGSRSAPGLIFLSKAHFCRVEGMNAELERWGWEDIDLIVRLQLLLGLERRQVGAVVHLSHGDDLRNLADEPRRRSEFRNALKCRANYHQGNYYGTYQRNVNQWIDQVKEHKNVKTKSNQPDANRR